MERNENLRSDKVLDSNVLLLYAENFVILVHQSFTVVVKVPTKARLVCITYKKPPTVLTLARPRCIIAAGLCSTLHTHAT